MTTARALTRTPKVLGADVELGNFILGDDAPGGTGAAASRRLLDEVRGVVSGLVPSPAASNPPGWNGGPDVNPQDIGRRFLPTNGGCVYIDMDHLEVALPETTSAYHHVAHWRAMLLLAREAAACANRRLRDGLHIEVVANNSDGLGQSYGSHVNVLLTREAWDNIIRRKSHFLAYLTAFQVSSIVFTGQGKVGSENGREPVAYQLSQRADFIETLLHYETTCERPIVNTRDEPLCGVAAWPPDGSMPDTGLARLHVIFYDSTLCDTATLLRVGTLQLIVAMLEASVVNPALALDDPLQALQAWSRDPSLGSRARTVSGGRLTAVDLQFRFLKEATRFADRGGFDGIVPRAAEILALWEDTLTKLRHRDFAALGRRLDWVLKRQLLERAMSRQPALTWDSPQIKCLDQLYANLDESTGLYWACETAGMVDRLVGDAEIQRALTEPPDDTRAWTRAHLLRRATPAAVELVDWDRVRLKLVMGGPGQRWLERRTVHMPRPFEFTRAGREDLFAGGRPLDEIVAALQPANDHTMARRLS